MIYKGELTKGIKFYKLLIESDGFTSELGKVALASGKLEAELILFLKRKELKGNYKKATLGTLIEKVEKYQLLDNTMISALKRTKNERNYITHNIYALFIDLIEETDLEKNNLLDTDVYAYLNEAWQLKENLNDLADIIQQINN